MANLDLTKYGITGTTEIIHNPGYEELFRDEMDPSLEGFDKGVLTELDAVNVMTGVYTGRSPKDKYIVMDDTSKDTVWWTTEGYKNDNHPMTEETWTVVRDLARNELCNKKLYVVDAFCGANKDTRMAIRFIMEVAWQAHFVTNMFIRPTEEELANFVPDFVVYTASKAKCLNYKELGLNSETVVAFNVTSREQVIINTWYGGEMKKGMFSMMNYYLPLNGMASMHCSANTDMNGENTALFFGLSGTGKTTLSTDPKREAQAKGQIQRIAQNLFSVPPGKGQHSHLSTSHSVTMRTKAASRLSAPAACLMASAVSQISRRPPRMMAMRSERASASSM